MNGKTAALLPVIVLLPLIGGIINGIFGKRLPRQVVYAVANFAVFAAFCMSVMVFWELMHAAEGADSTIRYHFYEWMAAGTYSFEIAWMADELTAIMMLVVTGVGSLIHLYSTSYMDEDPGYARYFAYINLFIFSMLNLVMGKNLAVMFVGWEGVGACSYLLIGFWFTDMQKAAAGQKAFVVNRIGDFGFVIGIFMLLAFAGGSVDFDSLRLHFSDGVHVLDSQLDITLICLALFIGACGKSAQIPLYVWLPDAMAGPTPVSALIHAATMVTAGVYMVARLNFIFALSPTAMAVVMMVGALTAFMAASIGLVQRDIKKVLAYSTVSQLGYMFVGVGAGAYAAGVFHLFTHAFFKACLFLGAGAIIHALHHEQDIYKMGGLKAKMPIIRWTFLISCVAIAGLPPFSGFFSKDAILTEALYLQPKVEKLTQYYEPALKKKARAAVIADARANKENLSVALADPSRLEAAEKTVHAAFVAGIERTHIWHIVAFILSLLGAAMTAFYMFRLYFLTFHGDYRGDQHTWDHAHDAPWPMAAALTILAGLAAVVGFLGLPFAHNHYNWFHKWLHPVLGRGDDFVHLGVDLTLPHELGMMALSVAVASGGIWWAYKQYKGGPIVDISGWSDFKKNAHAMLMDKYRIDELYDAIVIRPLKAASQTLFGVVDRLAIDVAMVRGPGYVLLGLGELGRRLHNGQVQAYLVGVVIGLAGLAFYLV